MKIYEKFMDSLLPGNYALTKSMELTKLRKSGTLWYTKKFLTLYYYVFLSNEIMTNEYINNVKYIFDTYINSLDEIVRDDAHQFFYPNNETINFNSPNFNTFSNFASYNSFENQDEKNIYYQNAKKYYFSLLMDSGGQTGVKKLLKEAVQQPGFVYSIKNIESAIDRAVYSICCEQANNNHKIIDHSVKYILSDNAIREICDESRLHNLSLADVKRIISIYPKESPKYRSISGDMIAFIRNERQILYYYGYFHSKSSGAKDFEFSSLTPIGELALTANSHEFLVIWEHQKIKMISQPATADINNIIATQNDPTLFGISFTPYTNILGHLIRRNSLSLDEYKYIVSRKKSSISEKDWIENEEEIFSNINIIKSRINRYNRLSDKQYEDSRKELLKYLLGIRCDLQKDSKTNPLNLLKFNKGCVTINDYDALQLLYNIYVKLDDYKIQKYMDVYNMSESYLRSNYINAYNDKKKYEDTTVKIHWDLYNIHADKFIMLCIMIIISAISLKYSKIEDISRDESNRLTEYIYEKYRVLLKHFGIQNLRSFNKEVRTVLFAISSEDYSYYINNIEDNNEQTIAKYRKIGAEDLWKKIMDISNATGVGYFENRKRNLLLVSMLKSYYIDIYSKNNTLNCECCGEETFISNAKEPYVEFHHLIPFNIAFGPDHYLNLFALCPNCHRKIHYLSNDDKQEQYEMLNKNNYLKKCITDRLKTLKSKNLLRSYHLEYLLADNAITIDEYNSIVE